MLYRNKINFKQELNYVVEAQNLKNEKLFQDMEEYLWKRFEKLLKHGQKTAPNQNQGVVQNSPIQPVKQNYNWLVLLRRQDGSEDFYRNWLEYKQGFGSSNGEFFIGLEKLHAITTYGGTHELLIVLEDFENSTRYAYYDEFLVGNEDERYGLKKLGKYSGNAGDALRLHVNAMFSTQDRDNDVWHQNCAELFKGAWWFVRCFNSHLTGPYIRASSPVGYNERGIIWKSFHGPKYSMKFVEMMIRPRH
uniref:Fibrinogen C-terminal domain-containing protein n=1 Tax=Stomoxys calcitrans TaxID=35570 RepID=A0A1I8Q8P2_STOCA